jgi:hypothetical protein
MIQIRFNFTHEALKLLPAILQRVANPVQPFGFTLVQDDLPLPLLDGVRDVFGDRADLLDHLDNGQINQF